MSKKNCHDIIYFSIIQPCVKYSEIYDEIKRNAIIELRVVVDFLVKTMQVNNLFFKHRRQDIPYILIFLKVYIRQGGILDTMGGSINIS